MHPLLFFPTLGLLDEILNFDDFSTQVLFFNLSIEEP